MWDGFEKIAIYVGVLVLTKAFSYAKHILQAFIIIYNNIISYFNHNHGINKFSCIFSGLLLS